MNTIQHAARSAYLMPLLRDSLGPTLILEWRVCVIKAYLYYFDIELIYACIRYQCGVRGIQFPRKEREGDDAENTSTSTLRGVFHNKMCKSKDPANGAFKTGETTTDDGTW